MKHSLILSALLISLITFSQEDSAGYFLNKLKNKNLSDSVRAWYNIKLGDCYLERNPASALNCSKEAYQLALNLGSETLLYHSTANLAETYAGITDYDNSLRFAAISLEYARSSQNQQWVFTALNLLGNINIKKEQLSNAKRNFDEAIKLIEKNPEILRQNRIYLNLANYYVASLNFKKSLEILKVGEAKAKEEQNEDDLMKIYSSLGLSCTFAGKPDSGLYYQFRALNYFNANGRKKDEAIAMLRIGTAYGLTNNNSKMEQYYNQAYEIFKSIGDNASAINTRMGKVNFYFRSFQFAKCLKELNMVEPESVKSGLKEPIALSFIYRAGIFAIMNDTARAAKYQQIAEELSKELKFPSFDKMNMMVKAVVLSTRFNSGKEDSLINKSLNAAKKEIPENMLESSLQSIALSKDFLKNNKEDFINTYKVFAPQDSLGASRYFDSLISKPIDSNLNVITGKQLVELETKYHNRQITDSLRTQMALVQLKESQKRKLWTGIGILSILILFIGFLLITLNNQKKKIAKEKRAVENLTGILKHETSRQFGELKTNIKNILTVEQPKQQVAKALTRVKTYEMLYNNLFISDGLASISLKNAFEKIFEYHCDENVSGIKPVFSVAGGEDIIFKKSDYLFQYMNELMANSFEHAFKGIEKPEISVSVVYHKPVYEITYRDNGIGFPEEKQNIVQGKGMYYIRAYATQNLHGILELNSNNGTEYKLTFDENNI